MAPRIVIIGGGSNQWVPSLLTDIANTRSLHEAELVLEDVNPEPLPRMAELAEHTSRLRNLAWKVSHTTNQRAALEGADFVVVAISTGGFDSMRHDVEIPIRYGIRMSVGDSGPAGVFRTLRSVPVMVGIARDMQEICPDAWMLNVTNPMTQLVRAMTREAQAKVVGLCHEVTICRFYLSMWLGESFLDLEPTVVGVNHLPIMTGLKVRGVDDGFDRLRALLDGPADARAERLPFPIPDGIGMGPSRRKPDEWTKQDLLDGNRVKIELFRRFGALPASNDRHLCEFFPGLLTEQSGWGERWGVHLTTIAERIAHEARYKADVETRLASSEVSQMPSGEMVAPLIDAMLRDKRATFPLNLPNAGQAPGIPDGVVVETMCVADGSGVRAGEPAVAPGVLGEYVRRMTAVDELSVQAALSGTRDDVIAALLADPLSSRIDYDEMVRMADEMLAATKPWLPQFA
jgi:alpha-galactosidase/6-phospho-beta-glucosidase family protein